MAIATYGDILSLIQKVHVMVEIIGCTTEFAKEYQDRLKVLSIHILDEDPGLLLRLLCGGEPPPVDHAFSEKVDEAFEELRGWVKTQGVPSA